MSPEENMDVVRDAMYQFFRVFEKQINLGNYEIGGKMLVVVFELIAGRMDPPLRLALRKEINDTLDRLGVEVFEDCKDFEDFLLGNREEED